MRIAIFGTGGVGGYFGAQLARAGEEVTFIARGAHAQAIRGRGLRLTTPTEEIVLQPTQVATDPAEIGPVDVVILAVKTWQVVEAAQALRPLLGAETWVLPLQNGLEAAGQIAAEIGAERVVGGLCNTLSWVAAPGHIHSISARNLVRFGELRPTVSDRTQHLLRAFEHAHVTAEIVPDMEAALWEKFMLVVPFGGVGAVTRAPIGVTRALPETRQMLVACMREIEAVARARNVALKPDLVESHLAIYDSLPHDGTASLQRDIEAGRPSELDAWNGAAVRFGQAAHVPTPTHAFIYHSLLPQEQRAQEQRARGGSHA